MSVSVLTSAHNICNRCRHTHEIIYLFCVSGDQGLIHNLILDSRIIGQLASRVWKNKDLNSWVNCHLSLYTASSNTVHQSKNMKKDILCKWEAKCFDGISVKINGVGSVKIDCCRYGFLAVFASSDGGITRVFPNVWVRLVYLLKHCNILVISQIFCP